ncbi:hypothetical protein AVEN_206982-1 [Araneus ventricosus]|uniref:Uncharacterized protein n=1 Tax=Araneus ventricosus TaxID=182803 RepID=A0A4Y2LJ37_ARAVE|nr:hypothetical protein AVEN_206982-1 [Araneus ventricosus]
MKHKDAYTLSRNQVEEETETSDKFPAVTTDLNIAFEQKKDTDFEKIILAQTCPSTDKKEFVLTSVKGFSSKSKHCIQYPKLHSAMRPVPHSEDLPIPTAPDKYTVDSE